MMISNNNNTETITKTKDNSILINLHKLIRGCLENSSISITKMYFAEHSENDIIVLYKSNIIKLSQIIFLNANSKYLLTLN
jgi:hypothetical protein